MRERDDDGEVGESRTYTRDRENPCEGETIPLAISNLAFVRERHSPQYSAILSERLDQWT